MDTVNTVVSAASKIIWGEQGTAAEETAHNETGGQEPISGVKGAGTKEEPFDVGNSEPSSVGTSATTETPASTLATTAPTATSSSSETTPLPLLEDTDKPAETTSTTATEAMNPKTAVAEEVQSSQPGSDFSGEPMKLLDDSENSATSVKPVVADTTGLSAGEESVKTSDLSAEGGDFGAAKPDAGKEATSLGDQKDVKQDSGSLDAVTDTSAATDDKDTKKASKMDRLKDKLQDKLHIGSGKHN